MIYLWWASAGLVLGCMIVDITLKVLRRYKLDRAFSILLSVQSYVALKYTTSDEDFMSINKAYAIVTNSLNQVCDEMVKLEKK